MWILIILSSLHMFVRTDCILESIYRTRLKKFYFKDNFINFHIFVHFLLQTSQK